MKTISLNNVSCTFRETTIRGAMSKLKWNPKVLKFFFFSSAIAIILRYNKWWTASIINGLNVVLFCFRLFCLKREFHKFQMKSYIQSHNKTKQTPPFSLLSRWHGFYCNCLFYLDDYWSANDKLLFCLIKCVLYSILVIIFHRYWKSRLKTCTIWKQDIQIQCHDIFIALTIKTKFFSL